MFFFSVSSFQPSPKLAKKLQQDTRKMNGIQQLCIAFLEKNATPVKIQSPGILILRFCK